MTTANVAKFWKESIPLRTSQTAYFVHPTGFDGIDCSLDDGQEIDWQGVKIRVLATPGHSPDHTAYVVGNQAFVGDAVTAEGKLWTPFTTDWDHWTDAGLKPAAASVRKLNGLTCHPARWLVVARPVAAPSGDDIERAGLHKSYEWHLNQYSKPQAYDFLVPKEQVGSNGSKPWAKVSDSLWITGNTYVLKAATGEVMVLDPWGETGVDQVAKLRHAEKLGPVELVMFSHAHFDHFDGVYTLPDPKQYKVWALDLVARPLEAPFRYRAPFLDARPVAFSNTFQDGETATWRGYRFKFHHLPGQSYFTAGIETTIDGKRCLFTADNWFHHTQYSGSGGWMGLNRSSPAWYGSSANKVMKMAPEWVLAEHGGPFAFNHLDFEMRERWGYDAATACDLVCPFSNHRRDWNPHAVSVSPIRCVAKAGGDVWAEISTDGMATQTQVIFDGRGIVPNQEFTHAARPNSAGWVSHVKFRLPADVAKGRYIFPVRAVGPGGEFADPFLAVDVE